jgi:GH25 family lysozyme M1 (1,4-beta-N-acetylmuramidase)
MANYTLNGIDVSHHQGVIDWKKVAASGINFVMIRAGYGKSASQIDKKFKTNIDGAYAAGIKNIGIYWYSYAGTVADVKLEAQACISVIKQYKDKITLPVFFDQEYES